MMTRYLACLCINSNKRRGVKIITQTSSIIKIRCSITGAHIDSTSLSIINPWLPRTTTTNFTRVSRPALRIIIYSIEFPDLLTSFCINSKNQTLKRLITTCVTTINDVASQLRRKGKVTTLTIFEICQLNFPFHFTAFLI